MEIENETRGKYGDWDNVPAGEYTPSDDELSEHYETMPADEIAETLPPYEDEGYDVKDVVRADAKSRSVRTLAQGAIAAVLIAVGTVAVELFQGIDADNIFSAETYAGFGAVAGTAALTAIIGYVQRRLEGSNRVN